MSRNSGLILLWVGVAIQIAALYVTSTTAHKGAGVFAALAVLASQFVIVGKLRETK